MQFLQPNLYDFDVIAFFQLALTILLPRAAQFLATLLLRMGSHGRGGNQWEISTRNVVGTEGFHTATHCESA